MNELVHFRGDKFFDRNALKKIFFGKSIDGDWMIRTVFLNRDSLNITIVKSMISGDTMRVITNLYLGIDINSEIVRS